MLTTHFVVCSFIVHLLILHFFKQHRWQISLFVFKNFVCSQNECPSVPCSPEHSCSIGNSYSLCSPYSLSSRVSNACGFYLCDCAITGPLISALFRAIPHNSVRYENSCARFSTTEFSGCKPYFLILKYSNCPSSIINVDLTPTFPYMLSQDFPKIQSYPQRISQDDLKLFKYDNSIVRCRLLPWI